MSGELRSAGSVRARGILVLIAVVLAAGLAGAAIDRVWVARHVSAAIAGEQAVTFGNPSEVAGAARHRRRLEEMQRGGEREGIPLSLRSLDMTADQHQRLEKITAHFRPVADSLMRSIRGPIAQLDLSMRQEAMCVLTPKQRYDWLGWRRREGIVVEDSAAMMKLVTENSCPK